MKCFTHSDDWAVGLCKFCCKAVCTKCIVTTSYGIACSAACAKELDSIRSLVENNKRSYIAGPKASLFGPVFNLIIGIVFAYYGYHKSGVTGFIFILGAIFIVFGISTFVWNKLFFKRIQTKYET